VIATLGRLDELRERGQLDGLLCSGARFSQAALVLTAQQKGELPVIGMISQDTIEQLQSQERGVHCILGARLRMAKEIRGKVLSHPGRYHQVRGPKNKSDDLSSGSRKAQMEECQLAKRESLIA
jgi:hypothetical protein